MFSNRTSKSKKRILYCNILKTLKCLYSIFLDWILITILHKNQILREAIKKTEKKINGILYIPKLLCVVRINDIMDVIMN